MIHSPSPLTKASQVLRGMFDVCIIGSGPVGVAFAEELSKDGLRIVMLECGQSQLDPLKAEWRHVPCTGLVIKPDSRERALGGSSTTWGGLSARLDPIDFTFRDWIPDSGWPLTLDELMPFYVEATRLYRFPDPAQTSLSAPSSLPTWKGMTHKLFQATDRPPNFATDFLLPRVARDLTLVTEATVLNLKGDLDSHRATHVTALDGQGIQQEIQARYFVLAAGAIENVRLLLASRFAHPNGLGNDHDQVGRFFMNHPKGWHGCLRPNKKLNWGGYADFNNAFGPAYYGLQLSEDQQRKLGVLNPYLRLEPAYDLLPEPLRKASSLLRRVTGRWPLQAPGLRIRNFMEMQPCPGNRIQLGEECDAQGQAIPQVTYNLTDLDRRSLAALHTLLDEELQEQGAGYVEDKLSASAQPWPVTEDASHHLGGARMGSDRRRSVTDQLGRLHGHPEIVLGGGCLFPTSGHVNPTWTMVALAIRSARALREQFRSHGSLPTT